jgi:hypothetical protein
MVLYLSGIFIWTINVDIFLHKLKCPFKVIKLNCIPGYPEHQCKILSVTLFRCHSFSPTFLLLLPDMSELHSEMPLICGMMTVLRHVLLVTGWLLSPDIVMTESVKYSRCPFRAKFCLMFINSLEYSCFSLQMVVAVSVSLCTLLS